MAYRGTIFGSYYFRNLLFSGIWITMLEHFYSYEMILMNQAGHLIYLQEHLAHVRSHQYPNEKDLRITHRIKDIKGRPNILQTYLTPSHRPSLRHDIVYLEFYLIVAKMKLLQFFRFFWFLRLHSTNRFGVVKSSKNNCFLLFFFGALDISWVQT